jgi:hypothetical protein
MDVAFSAESSLAHSNDTRSGVPSRYTVVGLGVASCAKEYTLPSPPANSTSVTNVGAAAGGAAASPARAVRAVRLPDAPSSRHTTCGTAPASCLWKVAKSSSCASATSSSSRLSSSAAAKCGKGLLRRPNVTMTATKNEGRQGLAWRKKVRQIQPAKIMHGTHAVARRIGFPGRHEPRASRAGSIPDGASATDVRSCRRAHPPCRQPSTPRAPRDAAPEPKRAAPRRRDTQARAAPRRSRRRGKRRGARLRVGQIQPESIMRAAPTPLRGT